MTATPATRVVSINLTVQRGQPFAKKFLTLNPDGTALDVSSGYTAGLDLIRSPNMDFSSGVGSGLGTMSFDTTGVTYTDTAGNTDGDFTCPSEKYRLWISQDSGATKSYIATGNVTINPKSSDTQPAWE